MVKDAFLTGNIYVKNGGMQWRPLLNVEDAASAYIRCLETPIYNVKGETFNVGSSNQNYRIIDIAKIIQ